MNAYTRSSLLMMSVGAVALVAMGCAKDPAKDVPKAQMAPSAPVAAEPVQAAPEPAAAQAPAEQVAAAEPAAAPATAGAGLSGSVIFIGSKVTGSHECAFETWQGSFQSAGGKLEGGTLKLSIDTASVKADHQAPNAFSAKLEKHLRSPDFFDSEAHPKATFESTAITAGGEGGTHTVAGRLQIRGITKDVVFPATLSMSDGQVSGKAEFSINRKDFQIVFKGMPDDLIRDDVVLKIALQGPAG